ncbi:MAG: MFS transporter [Acidimicrobiia bacterium]
MAGTDRLKWLVVGMTAVMGFTFSAIGPAMPLLRADLAISRTIAGLHLTALASGGLVVGAVLDRITRRLGRKTVFWIASWTMVGGAAIMGLGRVPQVTVAGALGAGWGGSALIATTRNTLADSDGASLARSMVQNDSSWSLRALLPGIVIATMVAIGLGWRAAFFIPIGAVALSSVLGRRLSFPVLSRDVDRSGPSIYVPRRFLLVWAAFIPAVAGEWSISSWSAGYMVETQGADPGPAALLVTGFFVAMFAGRAIGSRLTARVAHQRLFTGAIATAVSGSLVLLFAGSVQVAAIGLLVCGLGTSLLAPLLVAFAIEAMPSRPETATARISMAASIGILIAPFILGLLADQSGIRFAFGLIPALFGLSFTLAALSSRARPVRRAEGGSDRGGRLWES